MESVARYRVVAHGRVQGVWYRDSCQQRARREGVAGWVRNCSDGTVEAVFEGPLEAVARMVSWCRMGPPAAEVSRLDVLEGTPEGLHGFVIRR